MHGSITVEKNITDHHLDLPTNFSVLFQTTLVLRDNNWEFIFIWFGLAMDSFFVVVVFAF